MTRDHKSEASLEAEAVRPPRRSTLERSISVQEAADILSYDQVTIYRLIRRGELRAHKGTRGVRIYESSIEEFRDRHAVSAGEAMPAKPRKRRATGTAYREAKRRLDELLA